MEITEKLCRECMFDAPYEDCCKEKCGEYEYCRECEALCTHEESLCK